MAVLLDLHLRYINAFYQMLLSEEEQKQFVKEPHYSQHTMQVYN